MTTLALIALIWVGASVVATVFVAALLRVGSRAETVRDGDLAASLLGLEGVRRERPVVIARALAVATRRPRG
jgi:hypothetical protein